MKEMQKFIHSITNKNFILKKAKIKISVMRNRKKEKKIFVMKFLNSPKMQQHSQT